ncbi:MAG: serine/threonine protein kinase [Clostridium sp.]|nr:serine/threonine protein kinase [Clostridium sp.]
MNYTDLSLRAGIHLQGGKYVIKSILGRGGFGITYLACHTVLEKDVAIKEFFPSDFCDRNSDSSVRFSATKTEFMQKLKGKFTKEAKYIASLHHPNIITIFDIFEENGTAYYVMDYIEGCSLYEMVRKNGPLPPAKILKYIGEIGSALDYIHSKKIGHYDVKPANILVNENTDSSVLIDFGLSKQFKNDGENTSSLIGHTDGYAPIEQYGQSGEFAFSPTTDTYSLTATLYFLLCGYRPQTSTDIVHQGLKIPDNFPDKVRKIIRKGLSVKQNGRYGSCTELTRDLEVAIKSSSMKERLGGLWTGAKSGIAGIHSGKRDDVSVVSVSETEVEISIRSGSSAQPVSVAKSIASKSGPLYKRVRDKLKGWMNNHPGAIKKGILICNILIGIFLAIAAFKCAVFAYHVLCSSVYYYNVTNLTIKFSLLIFALLLWRYVLTDRKSKILMRYISIAYAMSWAFVLWDNYELCIPYIMGVCVLYAFYKLPKNIDTVMLVVFSCIMCSMI